MPATKRPHGIQLLWLERASDRRTDGPGTAVSRYVENIDREMQLVSTVLEEFAEKTDAIRADKNLSPEGKRAQLVKLHAEYERHLPDVRARMASHLAVVKTAEDKLDMVVPPHDAATVAQHREIRDAIAAMPREERHAAVQRAIEEGDRETLRAITLTPQVRRGDVGEFTREMARRALHRMVDPHTAADLETFRERLPVYVETLGHVRAVIGQMVGASDAAYAELRRGHAVHAGWLEGKDAFLAMKRGEKPQRAEDATEGEEAPADVAARRELELREREQRAAGAGGAAAQ